MDCYYSNNIVINKNKKQDFSEEIDHYVIIKLDNDYQDRLLFYVNFYQEDDIQHHQNQFQVCQNTYHYYYHHLLDNVDLDKINGKILYINDDMLEICLYDENHRKNDEYIQKLLRST